MAEEKKRKKVFVEGPISAQFIADSIAKHATKKDIGAHNIFLGQVREDAHGESAVAFIDYECYEEMAMQKFHEIREGAFAEYPLTCMHIYHSLGPVKVGEISLFVFTSSPHRRAAIDACNTIVERIKNEVPIWGVEVLQDGTRLAKQSNK
jgi:molybdopterin synthase catalytic subunit